VKQVPLVVAAALFLWGCSSSPSTPFDGTATITFSGEFGDEGDHTVIFEFDSAETENCRYGVTCSGAIRRRTITTGPVKISVEGPSTLIHEVAALLKGASLTLWLEHYPEGNACSPPFPQGDFAVFGLVEAPHGTDSTLPRFDFQAAYSGSVASDECSTIPTRLNTDGASRFERTVNETLERATAHDVSIAVTNLTRVLD